MHATSQAVYGSRDSQNRINRRTNKETLTGDIIPGIVNLHSTAAWHEDVDYLLRYQGMSRGEVDRMIMPMLAAVEAAVPFGIANRER